MCLLGTAMQRMQDASLNSKTQCDKAVAGGRGVMTGARTRVHTHAESRINDGARQQAGVDHPAAAHRADYTA
jgi:hypothetical protein